MKRLVYFGLITVDTDSLGRFFGIIIYSELYNFFHPIFFSFRDIQ